MSRRLIRALSTRACVFISRAFADEDSYKHTKSGNEKRRNGQAGVFVHVSKDLSKGGGGGGVVFRDFRCYKNNRNSQAVRVLILSLHTKDRIDRQSLHKGREVQL